jgi:hypothetical protein
MIDHRVQPIVVASQHRKPLVAEHLAGVPHEISLTPDYPLPPGFASRPEYAQLVANQVGAYRCFRGHQRALELLTRPFALIFEDDAVPITPDWWRIVNTALDLTDEFEVISLHGRELQPGTFALRDYNGIQLAEALPGSKLRVLGSLAYLITANAAFRFTRSHYSGFPADLFLCAHFRFALVEPSPFFHDRSQGSLVETAR